MLAAHRVVCRLPLLIATVVVMMMLGVTRLQELRRGAIGANLEAEGPLRRGHVARGNERTHAKRHQQEAGDPSAHHGFDDGVAHASQSIPRVVGDASVPVQRDPWP